MKTIYTKDKWNEFKENAPCLIDKIQKKLEKEYSYRRFRQSNYEPFEYALTELKQMDGLLFKYTDSDTICRIFMDTDYNPTFQLWNHEYKDLIVKIIKKYKFDVKPFLGDSPRLNSQFLNTSGKL